ncbi:hypothetical protein ACNF42_06730 [Cuniculiplasma sp. SKW3]|uniref:hypothetical protein n=1 Tax=Cuniculiplasma sp. SKW3 TaxID=3400170 RepID=UPI003FD4F8D4
MNDVKLDRKILDKKLCFYNISFRNEEFEGEVSKKLNYLNEESKNMVVDKLPQIKQIIEAKES